MNKKNNTKNLVSTAMFAALAYAAAFACSYIPKVAGFLSLDVKDAVIVLCALIFGSLWGAAISVLVPLIECITFSTTGWYGLVMNILSSLTFGLVTGLIYKYKRSFYGAITALIAGVFSVTAVMLLANILITPLYLTYVVGVPTTSGDIVRNYIPKILLPFNFLKATLNGGLVLLLYKPLSNVMKKARITEYRLSDNQEMRFDKRSLTVTVISAVVIVAAVCIIFFVL